LTLRSPGLRYWTTKTRSVAAVGICCGVGGVVVSLRQVQGWEDTRILSPFSWFGAAPAWLLSPLVCSLPIYLAVYYLYRLQMPRSLSCPSPATNRYVRLFPSPHTLRNLRSGGGEGWESLICCLWYPCVHKNIMRRAETINKNLDIFLVDSLRGYCCEPSQRRGN
jgi:hypothetical protein